MTQAKHLFPTQTVFDWVLARPVSAPDLHQARMVYVMWAAPGQGDRVIQLYVDGELAGHSASPVAREAWLLIDPQDAHQIELLAVDPNHAATPWPQWLAGIDPPTFPAASATVLRDLALPSDAVLSARVDDQPAVSTALFPADTPRGGFGAVFGQGRYAAPARHRHADRARTDP